MSISGVVMTVMASWCECVLVQNMHPISGCMIQNCPNNNVFIQCVLVQNMPDDFLLRNVNNQDIWVSEAESLEIREDSHVRIRIANIQLQPEKLVRCFLSGLVYGSLDPVAGCCLLVVRSTCIAANPYNIKLTVVHAETRAGCDA
jgi:hypothetical protein